MPETAVVAVGVWRLKHKKTPGRLYTFLATKSAEGSAC
jgi:hypothetical protein